MLGVMTMRLIDADKVLTQIGTICKLIDGEEGIPRHFIKGVTLALDAIGAMPTIEAEPVKHGRWKNTSTPNQLKCSNCDIIHFIAQYPHGNINFCPNCGAKMDGDKP